jgi:hypothetical protein
MLIFRQMVSIPICRLWSQPYRRCGPFRPVYRRLGSRDAFLYAFDLLGKGGSSEKCHHQT